MLLLVRQQLVLLVLLDELVMGRWWSWKPVESCSWQPTTNGFLHHPPLLVTQKSFLCFSSSSRPTQYFACFSRPLVLASGILLMFVLSSDQIQAILIKLLAGASWSVRHLMSVGRISISCGIGAHEHVAQNGTIVPFNRNQLADPGPVDGPKLGLMSFLILTSGLCRAPTSPVTPPMHMHETLV